MFFMYLGLCKLPKTSPRIKLLQNPSKIDTFLQKDHQHQQILSYENTLI